MGEGSATGVPWGDGRGKSDVGRPEGAFLGDNAERRGQQYVWRAPWMAIFPGAVISLAVFGFNLFGDALRDILGDFSKRISLFRVWVPD